MFDFVRKPLIWEAWDGALQEEIGEMAAFQLKSMQDLAVYRLLKGVSGQTIAEVGAGHSRLLPVLARQNQCVAIDGFEGRGGGPTAAQDVSGVQTIATYLGEMSPLLASESFDVVFSISVVEHVEALAAFHEDQLRILRPGGFFVHAIDMYVSDEPDDHNRRLFEIYRGWVTCSEGVEPLDQVYSGPFAFTCDLATNPDNIMHSWGRVAPSLVGLRQRAQCVSVLVGGRKRSRLSD